MDHTWFAHLIDINCVLELDVTNLITNRTRLLIFVRVMTLQDRRDGNGGYHESVIVS